MFGFGQSLIDTIDADDLWVEDHMILMTQWLISEENLQRMSRDQNGNVEETIDSSEVNTHEVNIRLELMTTVEKNEVGKFEQMGREMIEIFKCPRVRSVLANYSTIKAR